MEPANIIRSYSLPIGSKEGPCDVRLLTETGDEILRATEIAELHDHITGLRVDVDLSSIGPRIFSGGRQPILNGLDIPSVCFNLYRSSVTSLFKAAPSQTQKLDECPWLKACSQTIPVQKSD